MLIGAIMKRVQCIKSVILGISLWTIVGMYHQAEAMIHIPYGQASHETVQVGTDIKDVQYKGPMLHVPARQEITLPITIVFDPFISEPKYEGKYVQSGTSIISPSWFELDLKGLKESSKLSYEYVKEYTNKGYRVWPLITNQFNPDLTSKILKNESLWERYKQGLVNYAVEYGYDGYNFDFENIHYKDKSQMAKFVDFLAKGLRDNNLYSSIDITGYSDSENWSKSYDRKSYADSVDYVVLMAYDETWASSDKAGPVASYPWVRNHAETVLSEVPNSKLILGVPFYMREWTIPVKGSWQGKAKGKTLAMTKALALEETFKEAIRWDDSLKANYVTFTNTNGTYGIYDETKPYEGSITKIWFEDPQSLSYKMSIVNDLNLAGVAAWRKGFESPEAWPVISYALDSVYHKDGVKQTEPSALEKLEKQETKTKPSQSKKDKKDKKKDKNEKDKKQKDKKKDKKHKDKQEDIKDSTGTRSTTIVKDGKEVVLTFKRK